MSLYEQELNIDFDRSLSLSDLTYRIRQSLPMASNHSAKSTKNTKLSLQTTSEDFVQCIHPDETMLSSLDWSPASCRLPSLPSSPTSPAYSAVSLLGTAESTTSTALSGPLTVLAPLPGTPPPSRGPLLSRLSDPFMSVAASGSSHTIDPDTSPSELFMTANPESKAEPPSAARKRVRVSPPACRRHTVR